MEGQLPVLKNRDNLQWQIIEDVKNADFQLKMEVSTNSLIAILTVKKNSERVPNIVDIKQRVFSKKLVISDEEMLNSILDKLETSQGFVDLVIAKGVAPEHGKDGSFEKFFENKEKVNFAAIKDSVVDYKSVNKISSVVKGDKLARYIEETNGKDGIDVYGKPITSHKGKPGKYRAGKNARIDENSKDIFADVDGIPEETDGVFKVEPVFNVEKDVDLNVGHINFSGDVHVGGDVLDGFRIEAEGNIQVNGTIGASEIIAKGDVTVFGGIASRNKGVIRCKNLQAKFINEGVIEVEKDVNVLKEIINSQVGANGKITAMAIIGGRTIAKVGVGAQILGSEQNVETIIEVGVDFQYIKNYEDALEKLPELETKLQKQIALFRPFIDRPNKFVELEDEKKKGVLKVFEYFKVLKKQRLELESILDDCNLMFKLEKNKKKKVLVSKLLHEGVKFFSRFSVKKSTESHKGPLEVKEDVSNKTFIIGSS